MKGIVTVKAYYIQNNEHGDRYSEFRVDGEKLGPVTQFWLLPLVGEGDRVETLAVLNMGFVRYVEIDEPKPALAS